MRFGAKLGVHSLDEPAGFVVGRVLQDLPLVIVEGGSSQNGGGNGETIRRKKLEQSKGERQCSHRARRCRAQLLVNPRSLVPNGIKRVDDGRTAAVGAGTRDEVHQLAPAYRRIVPILGRLVQDGLQTIVKAH